VFYRWAEFATVSPLLIQWFSALTGRDDDYFIVASFVLRAPD
jgi:hypothetical protein